MRYCDAGLRPAHKIRQLPCEFRQRTFTEPLKTDPFRRIPVDHLRKRLAVFFAAGGTAADRRPEGHVDKNTVHVVLQNFRDLGFIKRERVRLIRTGEMIASVMIHSDIVDDPGVRQTAGAVVVIIDRVVRDGDNSRFAQSGDRLAENIASVQIGMNMPGLRRIIAVAVVIACVDHRGFHAGKPDHPDIFLRRKFPHV